MNVRIDKVITAIGKRAEISSSALLTYSRHIEEKNCEYGQRDVAASQKIKVQS